MRNAKCGMRNRTDRSPCRANRRHRDGYELACFVEQGRRPRLAFLLDDAQLCEKLPPRPCATRCSIVCPDRGTSAEQLVAEHVAAPTSRQILDETNDRKRESSGAILQIDMRHELTCMFRI